MRGPYLCGVSGYQRHWLAARPVLAAQEARHRGRAKGARRQKDIRDRSHLPLSPVLVQHEFGDQQVSDTAFPGDDLDAPEFKGGGK